jgi:hypothetical protein
MGSSRIVAAVVAAVVVVGAVGSIGCSGASGNEDLVAAPANEADMFAEQTGTVTSGVVTGLWGGFSTLDDTTLESRFRFSNGAVTVARRCSKGGVQTPIAYAKAGARISENEITVLEDKRDTTTAGDVTCVVELSRGTIRRCDEARDATTTCFSIAGKRLVFYGPAEEAIEFEKKAD